MEDADIESAAIYLIAYRDHKQRGDDPLNARLRISEAGCPTDVCDLIQKTEGDDE